MRIGIEFGGTHIKMGIVSDDGIVVRYNEKKLADLTDSEGIVQSLKQAVYDFIGDENIKKGGIVGDHSLMMPSTYNLRRPFP